MSHRRSRENRRRLKKLAAATSKWFGSGASYDEERGFYVRYYARGGSGYPKWLRTVANRKVRRAKNVPQCGGYRRIYDYWWELD